MPSPDITLEYPIFSLQISKRSLKSVIHCRSTDRRNHGIWAPDSGSCNISLKQEKTANSHLGQNITHGAKETRKFQVVNIATIRVINQHVQSSSELMYWNLTIWNLTIVLGYWSPTDSSAAYRCLPAVWLGHWDGHHCVYHRESGSKNQS